MTKEYIVFDELKEMLESDKNIISETMNERIFKEHSYYSLINPYKDYWCTNHLNGEHREYPKEIDFKTITQLKMADHYISSRLQVYIRIFEESLSANLVLIFTEKMKKLGDATCTNYSLFEELFIEGENQLGMLDVYHYYQNTKIVKATEMIEKKNREVISKIIRLGKKKVQLSNPLYEHYQKKNENIPILVVIEQLTLGELQTIFNLMKIKDKYKFVEQIYHKKVNPREVGMFSNKINYIRLLRNKVSHNEPIIAFINNCKTNMEKERFISIIKLLKANYYKSVIHLEISIEKPQLELTINKYNVEKVFFLNQVLKVV